MKKFLLTLFISVTACILLFNACGNRQLPSGPLDSTPTITPTPPQNIIEITLLDEGIPAIDVDLKIHYPNNFDKTIDGTTNDSGTATLNVYSFGTFTIEILPDTSHGFNESLFYDIEVRGSLNYKTIDRGAPEITVTLNPGQNPVYGADGAILFYTIHFTTATKKYHTLSIEGLAEEVITTFSNRIVENNNDESLLTLVIPQYTHSDLTDPRRLTFTVKATNLINNYIETSEQTILQNWYFDWWNYGNNIFQKQWTGYIKVTHTGNILFYSTNFPAKDDNFIATIDKCWMGDNGGNGAQVSYWTQLPTNGTELLGELKLFIAGNECTAPGCIWKISDGLESFEAGIYNMTGNKVKYNSAIASAVKLKFTNGIYTFYMNFKSDCNNCGSVYENFDFN